MRSTWFGPFKIIGTIGKNAFRLKLVETGEVIPEAINASKLKLFNERMEDKDTCGEKEIYEIIPKPKQTQSKSSSESSSESSTDSDEDESQNKADDPVVTFSGSQQVQIPRGIDLTPEKPTDKKKYHDKTDLLLREAAKIQ